MAIPWLVVLTNVPWKQVLDNAPKVADGAKKLWNAVGGKSFSPTLPEGRPERSPVSGADAPAMLQVRVAELERTAFDLHQQMLASSELIRTLADQNAELVKRIEANRVRAAWLTGAVIGCGIVAMLGLSLALFR